jgi:hypothetical protein
MTTDIETKRKRIETFAKIVGLLITGFIVAPFILIAIKGLIGLVVSFVVALVVINFTPAVAASLANWRLKALKMAAAANPIETLENQYADREAALIKIKDNIQASYAVLQDIYAQIQEHNEKFPNSPSPFVDKYVKMKAVIQMRGEKYKLARQNLVAYGEMIEEKRSDWKIAQSLAKASKLANVGQDFQSKLMQDTAITTIQDGLNTAFSELEVSLLDDQPSSQPAVIDAKPVAQLADKSGPPILDLGIDLGETAENKVPVYSSRPKPRAR